MNSQISKLQASLVLAGILFGYSAVASAADVPFTTNGIISITSAMPPIYNGQYVLQTTDFGFVWLDSVALQAGLVQAESNCAPGMPPSHSNIYVTGDCNGTGSVSSSGSAVLVRQFNSQCGAAALGSCDGPTVKGPARLTFGLGGTWPYLGDQGEIPDSTQAADPQGRTWKVEPVDFTGKSFNWHSTDGASQLDASSAATDAGAETETDAGQDSGSASAAVDSGAEAGSDAGRDSGSAGTAADSGAEPGRGAEQDSDPGKGCNCEVVGASRANGLLAAIAGAVGLFARRRRPRRSARACEPA